MKILVPVDENLYSMYAIRHAARLAANAWPEVVLLAMEKGTSNLDDNNSDFEDSHPKMRMLNKYYKDFLNQLGSNSR